MERSVRQLYRDCLRLVRHVAPGQTSGKAMALRNTVRTEFRKPLFPSLSSPNTTTTATATIITEEQRNLALESRKANAIRALSNYMLTVAAPKDSKLKTLAKEYHGRSVQQAQSVQNQQSNPENNDEKTTSSQ